MASEVQWWTALVERVSWHPSATLEVREQYSSPVPALTVTMVVPDSRRLGQEAKVVQTVSLPWASSFPTEQAAVHFLRYALTSIWMHEFDEWLRLDGELVCDPHASTKVGARV